MLNCQFCTIFIVINFEIIPILEGLPTLRKYMTIFQKNVTTCLDCIKEVCDIIGQTERNQSWKDKQGSDDIRYVN